MKSIEKIVILLSVVTLKGNEKGFICWVIIIVTMASKQTSQLANIGKWGITWSLRIAKFFKHRFLTKRKQILIIGQHQTPLATSLSPALAKTWQITRLHTHAPPPPPLLRPSHTDNTPNKSTSIKLSKKQEKKENEKEQICLDFYLHDSNYNTVEQSLTGRQFDSIIVLPEDSSEKYYNLQDEHIVTQFPTVHQRQLMRNIFAYRLASKYLTSSGVIIYSISERDFVKDINPLKTPGWNSAELVDAQTSYLGVIIGDRDYTDLNSWSVVALSQEKAAADPQMVAKYYKLWADSQRLPMPGSFALFKSSTSVKDAYVQYL